jgi:GNAT superfamily N-acetyltransferase
MGMTPDITPLDAADRAAVEVALDVRNAASAVDVPDYPPLCRYEFIGGLTHEVSYRIAERYVAWDGGVAVGYLGIVLPTRDNLDNAEVDIIVHPDHRRRGVGRALHAFAAERLRGHGRKRLLSYLVEGLRGGPERYPGSRAFAEAVGGQAALDEVRRRLDLTAVDEAALSDLLAAAWSRAAGYRLVTWQDRTPDGFAADAAYLEGRLLADAPMGTLDWEPEKIDTARLRESEDASAARQLATWSAGAVDEATGRLVALTTLASARSTPHHAWQWITLVDPDHRGRRLGTVVKVANLRFARERRPGLREIDTWNAAENQHMIAINEAMGFRPVDAWVNWQHEV